MEPTLTALRPSAPQWTEHLTIEELQRLTYFKWRYTLRSRGFDPSQEARLMFLKWRYRTGDLTD